MRKGEIINPLRGTPTGKAWGGMKQRCYNPNNPSYHRYGGRGIRVCGFLRHSARNLCSVIGVKPNNREISLDRINNDLNYSCGNCINCLERGWELNIRWATRRVQNRNKQCLNLITLHGETHCLSEWAEIYGLPRSGVSARYMHGIRGEDLFRPFTHERDSKGRWIFPKANDNGKARTYRKR